MKDAIISELPQENFIISLYFYFGLGLFLLAQAYWIFTKLRQTKTKETNERPKTRWERIKEICLVYFLSCVFTIYIRIRFDGNFYLVFIVVIHTYYWYYGFKIKS